MTVIRDASTRDLPAGDYVSEGLTVVVPDRCFPHMMIGDKANHPWPYLRRDVGHNWYCDRRAPLIGFLNRDEAVLLHNLALQFDGKPALEIGTWMGWSTCHLALAGLELDIVDPALANPDIAASVRHSLAAAGVLDHVHFHAMASPAGIRELAMEKPGPWSMFFVDGNHDAPGPERDVVACIEYAAADALVVFHDLVAPGVEEGLRTLWRQGWHVLIYQTMQVMGVAWRGRVRPVAHRPDPSINWSLPAHLLRYPVAGSPSAEDATRLSIAIAWSDREIARLETALRSAGTDAARSPAEIPAREITSGTSAPPVPESSPLDNPAPTLDAGLRDVREVLPARDAEEAGRARAQEADLVRLGSLLVTDEIGLDGSKAEQAHLRNRTQSREADVDDLRAVATARQNEIAAGRTRLACLVDQIQAQEAELARVRQEIGARDHEIRLLALEAGQHSEELAALSQTLSNLGASTSWRMTRPLRDARHHATSWRLALERRSRVLSSAAASLPATVTDMLRRATGVVRGRGSRAAVEAPARETPMDAAVLIAGSGVFDEAFYLAQLPNGLENGIDPIRHYLVSGAAQGLDPHPAFNTSFYCSSNPDVTAAGMNPLVHYVLSGAAEGRSPCPPPKPPEPPEPLEPPFPLETYALIAQSGVFDAAFYLGQCHSIEESGTDPIRHYILSGAREGLDPHPLFDTSFYLETNPDVLAAGTNPLEHYLLHGATELRDPHPLFDTSFHREMNPDVAEAGVNPLAHYIQNGAVEDRDPHPLFDTSFYFDQKPHLRGLGINPLVHFLQVGPTADFDPLSSSPDLPDTGICIVTPDIVGPVKNGGIGTACFHFARVLAEAGHSVSVLFTADVTDCQRAHWRKVYAQMGIKFIAVSDTPPVDRLVYGSTWFFERSWRAFEYLRRAHYAAIHFQDWHANGFWSIKAKRVGLAFETTTLTVMTHSCTKWINEGMHEFSTNPFETAKQVWAETYCMERCDLLLSPSRYMLEWVSRNHIVAPSPPRLTPYVWADGPAAAARARRPVDNSHLIFFGRLETRKGLHVFAEALRRLSRDGSDTLPRAVSFLGKHARVLGRPSADVLEELRRDLPTVEMRVINHFDYAQAMDYIRQSGGLVVMPSILDNYPLTVIECVQSGIPFIAAATGGIPEMVDAGVLFDPDAASLAARLKTRHAIDHAHVQHKYAASTAADVWLGLHTELLAAARTEGVSPEGNTRPPHVSVCIPFFNHQRYLQGLVGAFARQHYPAFEVILVNDGSSEDASREFERVATRCGDRRFQFHTTANHGPGAARNFAAARASGELLIFFDADNVPMGPDFIRTMVRALQRSGSDCMTSPYDIVDADSLFPSQRDVVATYRPIGPCIEAGFFENVLGDTTSIITREAFARLGGFPPHRESLNTECDGVRLSGQQRTWEDHEFLLNLCFKGGTLETFPEATFFYRQSPRTADQQANDFHNYQSLFAQLHSAPSKDLARIITAVGAPMLMPRADLQR